MQHNRPATASPLLHRPLCAAPSLLQYLVEEKQFDENRVRKAIERLQKCKGKNSQNRLESFFGPVTIKPAEKKHAPDPKGKGKPGKPGKSIAKKGKK